MSKADAYLGLDLGGTGAKAGIFGGDGALLGLGHKSFSPSSSEAGHSEIAIETVYEAAREATRRALEGTSARVLAMAVSSQGQTFVSLDKDDRPLHPAILWYDSRAASQAEQLKQAVAGFPGPLPWIGAIASAPKIMWLRERNSEAMRHARRFLLLPDYMAYRLTGQAATEPNTATSTGLIAEDSLDYHKGVLHAAGIEKDQLARVLPCGSPVAKLTPSMAREWGLSPDTMLVTGTNDQYAGALGAGNCRPGILSETSGTCLAIVTLAEAMPECVPPGLFVGRFPIPRYRFAMAFSKTAGVVLDWFRKTCCDNASFDTLNREAAAVPIGCRGVTMLPHFDGEISPEPNPGSRGMFANLTLHHSRADLYRAILEALAFCLFENILFLREQGFPSEVIRAIGGGAKDDFWLQMKADVVGMPIEQPAVTEAAVLGAAMLAAYGLGAFPSLEEASAGFYRRRKVFEPDLTHHRLYQEPFGRYRDLKLAQRGKGQARS